MNSVSSGKMGLGSKKDKIVKKSMKILKEARNLRKEFTKFISEQKNQPYTNKKYIEGKLNQ